MSFTPPPGTSANFVAAGYYEPGGIRHAYRFPPGTYVPANGGTLAFFESWYPYPVGTTADFSVPAATAADGIGAITLDIVVEGNGTFTDTVVEGASAITLDVAVAGVAQHGESAHGAITLDALSVDGHGLHGESAHGAIALGLSVSGAVTVERYELVGEVRLQGVLVNRLVRAYRRDTGELVGEAMTAAGRFRVHTGFAAREHCILPIDLAGDATDWAPPCANRVLSVLAQDTA